MNLGEIIEDGGTARFFEGGQIGIRKLKRSSIRSAGIERG